MPNNPPAPEKAPDLLPCPFCGEQQSVRYIDYSGGKDYVAECTNPECNVRPVTMAWESEEVLAEHWNTRPPQPEADAKNTTLHAPHNPELNAETLRTFADVLGSNLSYLQTGGDFIAALGRLRMLERALRKLAEQPDPSERERERDERIMHALAVSNSLLRLVLDATYNSEDGWNPHPNVDNDTWSRDAHIRLTFTVHELRAVKAALKSNRAALSEARAALESRDAGEVESE